MYEISLADAKREFPIITKLNPYTIKVTEAEDNFNSWRPTASIRHTFADPKREEYHLYVASEDWGLMKIKAQFGLEEIYPAQNFYAYESEYPNDTREEGETIGEALTREVKQPVQYVVLHYQKWNTPDKTSELQANEITIGFMRKSSNGWIFISYAREDKSRVLPIYNKLIERGYNAWIDDKQLIPGQNWDQEIQKTINESKVFIACLSNSSVSKKGYVQKELKKGFDVFQEYPEGDIFIIPIILEECKVPFIFEKIQWIKLNDDDFFEKLYKSIDKSLRR